MKRIRTTGSRSVSGSDIFREIIATALMMGAMTGVARGELRSLSDDTILTSVKRDMSARRGRVASVRYVIEGTVTLPKGIFTDDPDNPSGAVNPSADVTAEVRREFMLDFERGKVRLNRWQPSWVTSEMRVESLYEELVSDGMEIRLRRPRDINEEVGEWRSGLDEVAIFAVDEPGAPVIWTTSDLPILLGHGIPPAPWPRGPFAAVFGDRDWRVGVRMAGRGGARGQVVLIHQVPPIGRAPAPSAAAELHCQVDLDRASAIVRVARMSGGHTRQFLDIEYQQTEIGWLPKRWNDAAYYDAEAEKLFYATTMHVTDVDWNLPQDAWDLSTTPAPGNVLREPGGKRFRIGPDGTREAHHSHGGASIEGRESRGRAWNLALGLLLLIGVGVGMWRLNH